MRFLPVLEIGHQLVQVPFPDVLAIQLAEGFLTQTGNDRAEFFKRCLLSSPPLLFWLHHKWLSDRANDPSFVPVHEDQLVIELLALLEHSGQFLIRDNVKPLSSVHRIDIARFIEVSCFFELREEKSETVGAMVCARLSVLSRAMEKEQSLATASSSATRSVGFATDVNLESLQRDFDQTDFAGYEKRDELEKDWQLDLPFFRNGLQSFDEHFERLSQLENEFALLLEQAKLSAIRQLAYGASHEVNNPLANISTRAQALLRDETDPKRRQRLMTIDAQAFRAHDMIANLMTFAKPRRPECARFQLAPVISSTVEKLQWLANEHSVKIRQEVDSSVYLEADREQLDEMAYALVQNAIESIRRDGEVIIRCQRGKDSEPIKLEFIDTGPGISADVRPHIFDPFFSGREAGRGLGFGLSKVWRLMELHQGSIRVTTSNGNTCFELIFPNRQDPANMVDREKTA